MTTTTERELHSPVNGTVPTVDSPAVRARARVIPDTQRDGNEKPDRSTRERGWSVWTAQPGSLQQVWRQSAVDPKRIPAKNGLLKLLWHVDNWTTRLLMFALAVLPTALSAGARWCAQRPTRRWALKFTVAALAVALILGKAY